MMKLASRGYHRGALVELWSDGDQVVKITKKVKFARRRRWYDRLRDALHAQYLWLRLLAEKPRRCL